MAKPSENLSPVFVSETSPLNDGDYSQEYEESSSFESYGCGCFQGLCFRWRRVCNGYYLHQQQDYEIRESWLKKRLKKVKEISEVIAEPKWKTFLRRFHVPKKRSSKLQFLYDSESYKLNFDDGIDEEIDGSERMDFSARFSGAVGIGRGKFGRDPACFWTSY